ncbi:hypothetical protein F5144DRAFT_574142 [Chaetomium tenue]|uniref:Uncharacterized protein n=1 Tax=Chaetomium tenue TaxID=1854479 RepID=A0ACB7PAH2_9PEZI|nr:hypothetical protein F5144DRAFT_574142 [Chaetomium globosum]
MAREPHFCKVSAYGPVENCTSPQPRQLPCLLFAAMQEFLDLAWLLRVGTLSSTVWLSCVSVICVVLSRRRPNRKRTAETGPSQNPTFYTSCPKTFDSAWIVQVFAVVIAVGGFFTKGLLLRRGSDLIEGADAVRLRRLGDVLGNVATALQIYRSLSEHAHWLRFWPRGRVWALWLYFPVSAAVLAALIGSVFAPVNYRKVFTCTAVSTVCAWSGVGCLVKIRETRKFSCWREMGWKWCAVLSMCIACTAVSWATAIPDCNHHTHQRKVKCDKSISRCI